MRVMAENSEGQLAITGRLRNTLYLNPQQRRLSGNRLGTLGGFYNFNGMHWLRLHPVTTPAPRMLRRFFSRTIANCAIRSVIANVRGPAAGVPIDKEAGPTVMVHWFGHARGRDGDFEHAYKLIFENYFMTSGSGLNGVVPVWVAGFILAKNVKMCRAQNDRNQKNKEGCFSRAR